MLIPGSYKYNHILRNEIHFGEREEQSRIIQSGAAWVIVAAEPKASRTQYKVVLNKSDWGLV